MPGDCSGADRYAKWAGRILGLEVRTYPAEWQSEGLNAGPLRNLVMMVAEHPDSQGVRIDKALVFHPDLTKSVGTANMVKRLIAAEIPFEHFRV